MASLALAFDLIGRDISASKAFRDVGDSADRAGKKSEEFGAASSRGWKIAGAAALVGVGALVAGLAEGVKGAIEYEKITARTANVIKQTGGAAGVSAKQVADLGSEIEGYSALTNEAVESGENLLLTFTNVRNQTGKNNDIFNQATKIMADMSVALGQDMKSSALQLGKALNDPIKGMTALRRVGVSFTESQTEQVKAMVAAGDQMGAQKLILAELSKEFGGAAQAAGQTLGGSLERLKNQFSDMLRDSVRPLLPAIESLVKLFADHLVPAMSGVAGFVGGALAGAFHALGGVLSGIGTAVEAVANFFGGLPGPIKAGVVVLGLLVLLKGPLVSMFETVALKALYMADTVAATSLSMGGLKSAGSGLMSFFGGPWGLAITGVTVGLGFLISWLSSSSKATEHVTQATKDYAGALESANGAIDDSVRKAAAKAAQDSGLLSVADRLHISLPQVTDAITGQGAALDATRTALQANIEAHTHFQTAGHLVTKVLDDQGQASQNALNALNALSGQTKTSEGDQKQLSRATQATGDAMAGIVPQTEEAKKALADWLKQLQQIGDGFVQPLSIYEDLLSEKQQKEQESAQATADATASSKDSWKDYVKDVSVSLDDYAKKLEEQIANQDNWRVNIGKIAQRGGLEVAQILANMGAQGADLTAQMATATDANFQRMAQDLIRDAANGGAGAAAALDQQMKVMAEIGREGGAATAQAVASALGVGINDVASIAASYGVTLATGLEPILHGLGKPPIVVPGFVTRPGLIGRNADGGFIKGPGTGRSDSIFSFLSNGEFVINADATAKHRPLLEAINSAPRFATGGFVSPGSVPGPYSTAPYGALVASPSDGTMSTEFSAVTDWLKTNLFSAIGGPGGGAEQWRSLVLQVLGILGQSGSLVNGVLQLIAHESGGNPNAINLTDSNAKAGHPSQGLMQTIPGTFAAYAGPYRGLGITNPLANIYAGLNYGIHRYGSIANIPGIASLAHGGGYKPYDSGGWLQPGYTLAMNGTGKPERVRTAEQEAALQQQLGGGGGNLTLQLDAGAVTDLLEGKVVEFADLHFNRTAYN